MQKFLFIGFVLGAWNSLGQNKVELTIQPSTAEVGETFEVTVTSSEVGTIDFSNVPDEFVKDYAVQQGSSQHTDHTGKTTIIHYYTISGVIKKEGNYTFGPVTLSRGNISHVSNTALINISPKVKMKSGNVTSQQFRDPAFGVIEANKTRLYEGEPLLIRGKIYARYRPTHVQNYVQYDLNGALVKYPIGNNGTLKTMVERFRGEDFYAIDYDKNVVFPTGVGTMTIEPYQMNLHQGYQSFPLKSSDLKITVLPLPANPPTDFIGGVGTFEVSRELPEKSFDQGDVIKMTVRISGRGNLHNITAPQLNLPKGFTIYGDPVVTEDYSVGVHGSEGTISYEFNIEVAASGLTHLPPTTITFFDPYIERYITTETKDDSLDIKPSATFQATAADNSTDERTNELVVQEFNPREKGESIKPGNIFGSGIFWGGISMPLASAFLFLLFMRTRENAEEKNAIKQAKNKQSARISALLAEAQNNIQSADPAAFYSAVEKTIRSTFAIRMQQPDDAVLSKKEIVDFAGTIDPTIKQETAALFEACEIARFSFGMQEDKRSAHFSQLEALLNTLKQKR